MAGREPAIQGRKFGICRLGWAGREGHPPTALRADRGPPMV